MDSSGVRSDALDGGVVKVEVQTDVVDCGFE